MLVDEIQGLCDIACEYKKRGLKYKYDIWWVEAF